MSTPAEICVRNSLHWYEAIFRTHRLDGAIVDGLWLSHGDVPPYYSNAMTLVPSPVGPQLAALRDLRSALHGPWSVKDSFAALDLAPLGFEPLFDAEWVWRDPSPPPTTDPGDVSWQRVTTNVDLDHWEKAWRDNGSPTDRRVFLPELLADPTVALFAAYRRDDMVGGCAANMSTDAVGLSNIFSADRDAEAVVAGALAAVSRFAPGLPIVGYEAWGCTRASQATRFPDRRSASRLDRGRGLTTASERALSGRRRTSTIRCAAARRRSRVPGSRPEAARAATGTPGDPPLPARARPPAPT